MKVVQYNAITINGYIAKEDDDTSFTSEEDWEGFRKIARECGAIIIGRRTYELMSSGNELVEGCLHVVFTTNPYLKSEDPQIFITRNSPLEVLKILEGRGYRRVCVAGGGKLNSSFMKEGLIDEIYLDIEPVIFGKGIQLFFPDDFEYQLKLLGVKKLNPHTVQLHYEIVK